MTIDSIVDWVYSKTQILLATLRTQNQSQVSLVYLCEGSCKLDVQEANISVSQFHSIRDYYTRC